MNAFTIKDLENLSGIRAHTIRIWEQRYDFLKPQRTHTNIRYYNNEELKTVLNVALLNKYGFKISHINRMVPAEIQSKILALTDPRAIQERIVNELIRDMADLDMEKFEAVMARYIAEKGVERTVIQVIFPFLEKIGLLWQTGHINPAQEHLVTHIIRQKLIVAIETTVSTISLDKSFILFLPEGEYHELGLLFMYYLLKSRGAKTIYLGANVPLSDVEYVVKQKKPDIAFVHLTTMASDFQLDKFLGQWQKKLGTVETIFSGHPVQHYRRKPPANVSFKKSLPEIMAYVSGL